MAGQAYGKATPGLSPLSDTVGTVPWLLLPCTFTTASSFVSLPPPSVQRLHIHHTVIFSWVSQVALEVKNPPVNAGDVKVVGSIPGLGRYPGGGHGSPLQYSFLENPHGQRSLVGYSP